MAKIEIKHPFPTKDSSQCYQACLRLVDKAGYKVFKKREIASLVICEGNIDGQHVDLSAVVPFGFPTSVVLTISSETVSNESLEAEVNRLFNLLGAELQ